MHHFNVLEFLKILLYITVCLLVLCIFVHTYLRYIYALLLVVVVVMANSEKPMI